MELVNTYLRSKVCDCRISDILRELKKQMRQCLVASEKSVEASEYVMFSVKVSATPCPSEEGRVTATTGYISLIS